MTSNEELVIYSVYLSHDDRSAMRQLNELQNHIFLNGLNQSVRTVISGDFNFDGACHQNHNHRENKLSQIAFSLGAIDAASVFSVAGPTWIGPGGRAFQKSSRIDRILTNDFAFFKHFVTFFNPFSDHRAMIISSKKAEY